MGLFEDVYDYGTRAIKAVENPMDTIIELADVGTQIMSGGLIGVNKKGLKQGVTVDEAGKGLSKLSGNDALIEAQQETRNALAADAAAKAKELKGEQTRKLQQDIQSSQYAGAARRSASAQQRNSLGTSNFTQDFLGV